MNAAIVGDVATVAVVAGAAGFEAVAGAAGLAAGAAGAAGVTGVWALAATVQAANNRIIDVYFMAYFSSQRFLTGVYQVLRQLSTPPTALPAVRFGEPGVRSRSIHGWRARPRLWRPCRRVWECRAPQ